MIESMTIWGVNAFEEHDSLIELSSRDRERIKNKIKSLDEKWGVSLNKSVYENSYDNDDYLFVSDLICDVRELHRKMFYNPYDKEWIRQNSEIPYIHLEFVNRSAGKLNEWGEFIPDDKKLNMGIYPTKDSDSYTLWINYYWLNRYISFLQTVFDSNEETVFSLPKDAEVKNQAEYKSKAEISAIAADLVRKGMKKQAKELLVYANSFPDCDKIAMPILTFLKTDGEEQTVAWSFWDDEAKAFKIPMKKKIYNTSGFAHFFEKRVSLISELFINSLKMLLAHEVAHVARGHWLLRGAETEYSMKRNVMMNCEINADWTAAQWILVELLYDTKDLNVYSVVLAYDEKALIEIMSVRILAIYLSLSWMQQGEEDRIWSEETVKSFVENPDATHPIYEFRLFSVLNHVKFHLEHMAEQNRKQEIPLRCIDEKELNKDLFDAVWRRACDMIFSFEYAFRACRGDDERDTLEKIKESLYVIENSMPDEKEKIPFYVGYMKMAQEELMKYEAQWPEILGKLREHGMYYRM